MHTLFLLSMVMLAAAVGGVGALVMRFAGNGGRRVVALTVLAAPVAVLVAAGVHVVPRFWPDCSPLLGWDRLTTLGLLGIIGAVGAGALVLNVTRVVMIERLLGAAEPLRDAPVHARVATLASGLGVRPPRLRLLNMERPLAVSGGLAQPTIVLSSWLLDRLDPAELEAVLAHELAHLAGRDQLVRWFGRLLRDATAYLPSAWYALRVLEADDELTADCLAVQATRRPLAMASALGKVWYGAARAAPALSMSGLPGYAGASASLLEDRIQRLLDGRAMRRAAWRSRLLAGAGLLGVGELTPRLLAASASALPLVCMVRPG